MWSQSSDSGIYHAVVQGLASIHTQVIATCSEGSSFEEVEALVDKHSAKFLDTLKNYGIIKLTAVPVTKDE